MTRMTLWLSELAEELGPDLRRSPPDRCCLPGAGVRRGDQETQPARDIAHGLSQLRAGVRQLHDTGAPKSPDLPDHLPAG